MSRVLVTGASGFIGSNLTKKLFETEKVIGLDKDINLKRLPIDAPYIIYYTLNYVNNNFSFIRDNLANIENYSYLKQIDTIFHLASSADSERSLVDTTYDFRDGIVLTHKVLEYMRKHDINKLIYSSSSAVYGEESTMPSLENAEYLKPISLYGAQKLSSEAFIHAYCNLYGIKAWIFRFANVVGSGVHRGAIYDFMNKLKKNPNKLEVLGDGNQEKSFFDVSDCVDALINIPKKDKNMDVEIYNLSNSKTLTVKKLVEIVCDELGLKPEIKFSKSDRGWNGDVPITILNIKKALGMGWKPKYNCEESIRRTVRYLNEEMS